MGGLCLISNFVFVGDVFEGLLLGFIVMQNFFGVVEYFRLCVGRDVIVMEGSVGGDEDGVGVE